MGSWVPREPRGAHGTHGPYGPRGPMDPCAPMDPWALWTLGPLDPGPFGPPREPSGTQDIHGYYPWRKLYKQRGPGPFPGGRLAVDSIAYSLTSGFWSGRRSRRSRRRRRTVEAGFNIKSNNPNLEGGEQHQP